MTLKIFHAEEAHLDPLAQLFDAYRVFYGQPSDFHAARHFIFYRLMNDDSVIFLATEGGKEDEPLGFVQLYPSFSSVAMDSIWILNDLYVKPKARRQGVAKKLIEQCVQLCKDRGDHKLVLETQTTNTDAKALYDKMGFKLDKEFDHYSLAASKV
ncbi:MAG: GNAT family N-acetyltransferase [Vampirovibrio sp.]|nr:GNAT family N-acetyltransferase [Vampirovibrio sp.]